MKQVMVLGLFMIAGLGVGNADAQNSDVRQNNLKSMRPSVVQSLEVRVKAAEEKALAAEKRAIAAEKRIQAMESRARRAESRLIVLEAQLRAGKTVRSDGVSESTRRQHEELRLREAIGSAGQNR